MSEPMLLLSDAERALSETVADAQRESDAHGRKMFDAGWRACIVRMSHLSSEERDALLRWAHS